MKVNVISRKLIKPCTPTPQNLNKYKISLRDELSPPININVILFYPPNPPKPTILSHLQASLAKILPQFYPLAGRYIKNDHLVDCNDEGAEFVEAEANDFTIIACKTKDDPLNNLLSRQIYDIDKPTDPLLSIQVTKFKCGELAIGISVSHRIFDASSLGTFIAAWSSASDIITPTFDSPSLFPRKNHTNDSQTQRDVNVRDNIVVKRLLYTKEDITNLRSRLKPNNSGLFVGRVRVVTALIARAQIGVEIAKHGKSRACFICQPVNMRGRTIPPLPKHSCGNLSIISAAKCTTAYGIIGFQELVSALGDAIAKTIVDIAEMLSLGGEDGRNVTLDAMAKLRERFCADGGVSVLFFSDWSKFGFYEVDFGWGKPIWAGFGKMTRRNTTTLIDDKEGGGVEAWVHLDQDDVPSFERYLKLAEMDSEDF